MHLLFSFSLIIKKPNLQIQKTWPMPQIYLFIYLFRPVMVSQQIDSSGFYIVPHAGKAKIESRKMISISAWDAHVSSHDPMDTYLGISPTELNSTNLAISVNTLGAYWIVYTHTHPAQFWHCLHLNWFLVHERMSACAHVCTLLVNGYLLISALICHSKTLYFLLHSLRSKID